MKQKSIFNGPFFLSALLLYPAVFFLMRIPEAWAQSFGALYMQEGGLAQTLLQVGWELVCLGAFNVIFICVTGVCLREVKLKESFDDLRPTIVLIWILLQAMILFVPYVIKGGLSGGSLPLPVVYVIAYLADYLLCVLLCACSPVEASWVSAFWLRLKKNWLLFLAVGCGVSLVCAALAAVLPMGGEGAGSWLIDALYQWLVLAAAFAVCIQFKNSIPVQD